MFLDFFAVNDVLSSFAFSVDEPTNSASSFEMIDGLDQNDFTEQKVNNGMCSSFLMLFLIKYEIYTLFLTSSLSKGFTIGTIY